MFETTIRVLGGMLTAYELSNDRVFLARCACASSVSWTGCVAHVRVVYVGRALAMQPRLLPDSI